MKTRVTACLAASACAAASALALFQAPLSASAATPAWLDRFNAWRAASNLPPLSENATWDQGDVAHSQYMVMDDLVTHYEDSTKPYYTAAGDAAARNGNIQVSSTTAATDDQAIDWWMGAPFHALGMLDPRLTSTGFGSYRYSKSGWQAGFTLDVLRGNSFTGGTYPVFFPGNGSSVPLTTYSGNEFPDPLQACPGYTTPVGLPLFVEVGGNVATSAAADVLTGNGTPLAHCVIDSSNAAVGSSLTSRGAVIVIPRQPLQTGVQYTVALTVNGAPYTWTFGVSTSNTIVPPIPAGWSSLGGVSTSGAAASSWGSTRLDAFARGADASLQHRAWNGTAWAAWESLGGVMADQPGAASPAVNTVDVFVRGADNAVWHRSWNGTAWGGWSSVGGIVTSGVGAASAAAGQIDIVVRGADNAVWQRTWNGTAWSGWNSLGGVVTSTPAIVSTGANHLDVYVRGADRALWHRSWDGATWGAWAPLGGILGSAPSAASCTAGHVDAYALGADGSLWHSGFNGTAWSAWGPVSGLWATAPAAVCEPGTTAVQLFEVTYADLLVQSSAAAS